MYYILTQNVRLNGGDKVSRINVCKLKGKMTEKGYTITSMSEALHISRSTMSGYLKKPDKIPYGIILEMANMLCESADEAKEIFFSCNLRTA